ncbi:MAG TPA: Maf family protein [Tepidisphaeraceae bacterium]|nr:Maf family protein [Tepidisphaeraceae bacterium]
MPTPPPSPPRLILASGSPRRRQLLQEAGYTFDVHPADIDESSYPRDLEPDQVPLHLATAKALIVAQQFPHDIILAADTVVVLGNHLLGKPRDAIDARRMLTDLAGTTHHCVTAVAIVHRGSTRTAVVTSAVHMRPLGEAEIDAYIASGRWEGKAGGYGIQDDDPFVTRMDGSLTNIVGLPMDESRALLRNVGVEPA